ncbi:MAG: hypothetical protein KDI56_17850 [Xanthomonadales bacterium]|nr:hypothetical protein [Xanthomonadales bacterium]
MSTDDPVILQIIPAPGWWACYDGGVTEPVMAFALVEEQGARRVASVVADFRVPMLAEDADGFAGLKYRGPWVAPE